MIEPKTKYFCPSWSFRIADLRGLVIIFFVLGNLCLTNSLAAENPSSVYSQIDDYVTAEMLGLKTKGLALGIVNGDEILYLNGYGEANSEGGKVTPQTPFVLASLTKSFTAVAVMQLSERGLIDLDAPVTQYIQWFQTKNEVESRKITIRHLLNQSSGLPTVCGRQPAESYDATPDALEYRVRGLRNVHLSEPVGEVFQYSNCNFYTAGLVIQSVSGQDYRVYIRENILQPLQMNGSYTNIDDARSNGLAQGYVSWFGFPVAYDGIFPLSNYPSCCVVSNATDMTHYLIAHLNEGSFRETSLVSNEGMTELHMPALEDGDRDIYYAMGWRAGEMNGQSAIWHSGDRGGYQSFMALLPAEGRGVVILSNTFDIFTAERFSSIAENIFKILDGEEVEVENSFASLIGTSFVVGLVVIQLAGMFLSLARIKRWRSDPLSIPHRKAALGIHILIPLLINLAWAGFVLIRLPLVFAPISTILVMIPGLGYLLVASAVLALIWGIVRTLIVSLLIKYVEPNSAA